MSLADESDFWGHVRLIAREEAMRAHDGGSPYAEDGIIADGSYNPKDGTVSVWLTETASILSDGTEQPLLRQGIQLLTPIRGQQAGPVGGERVILIRRHSGWLAVLEHGEDDSPGAPAGEHFYIHKTGSFQKFQNSGNVSVHANAQHQVTAASSTHTVTGSEAHNAQTFSATATTSASMTAPSTQIGPSGGPYLNIGGGGLGGTYALVRVYELNALIALFNLHTHGNVQSGSDHSGTPSVVATSAIGATNATAG